MFFLICSVFSVGSYQGDEYFQIVEFASSKLSLTNAADLTWEYHAKCGHGCSRPSMPALRGQPSWSASTVL